MIKRIKNAVTKRLKDNFKDCNVYTRYVEQGYKEPCFFVTPFPLSVEARSGDYDRVEQSIKIEYAPQALEFDELAEIADKIRDIFVCRLLTLEDGTQLMCYGVTFDIQDFMLSITLVYSYTENSRNSEEQYTEAAETIEIGGIL